MRPIAVVGNLVLDVAVGADFATVVPGHQAQAEIGFLAGGGLGNVGLRLEELGHRVLPLGALGDDGAGRLLASLLPWPVSVVAGTSTEASIIGTAGERTILNALGTAALDREAAEQQLPSDGVVVFAYLNSCGLPVADIPAVIREARDRGAIVVGALNGVFTDERRAMVQSVLEQLDLLVVNAVEVLWLTGTDTPEGLPMPCLVTRGAEGVTLIGDGETQLLSTAPIADGRTLAAGDAFLAGVAAELAAGGDWRAAAAAGQRAAAAWVGRRPLKMISP